MDTNTASAVNNAVAKGLPVWIEIGGETLPQMAPLVARNAEGAVQAGKTALNLLKGAGVAVGTGMLVGSGTLLFVGGFMSVFWVAAKAKDAISDKLEERRENKAKAAAMGSKVEDHGTHGVVRGDPAPA